MKCICTKPLKISEKSGKLLKTCGDKKCIDELRNQSFRKKLQGTVNKEFIEEKLLTKTGKLNPNLIKLMEYSIEELYCIYYNIERQICKCGEFKTFLTFQTGYRMTCGNPFCSNSIPEKILKEKQTKLEKYGDENYSNKEKSAKTNINKYGNKMYLATTEGQAKRRIPLLAKGLIKSDEYKTDYEIYRRNVDRLTSKNPIHLLENFNKRGVTGYHLDHKFSVSEGFKQNILPYHIASMKNLEMIDGSLNRQKSTNCSISREDLFKI